ncbi:hypothetical protein D6745_03735 [Candidatus Woesearchaeota archaeon]|nr:MAG: hypothetical protein D6745_03735 [Candidatus Woesearchaeota archaeon]
MRILPRYEIDQGRVPFATGLEYATGSDSEEWTNLDRTRILSVLNDLQRSGVLNFSPIERTVEITFRDGHSYLLATGSPVEGNFQPEAVFPHLDHSTAQYNALYYIDKGTNSVVYRPQEGFGSWEHKDLLLVDMAITKLTNELSERFLAEEKARAESDD